MYYIEICVLYRKKNNNKYNIAINRVSYLTSKEITVRVVYSERRYSIETLVGDKNRICQFIQVVSHQEPYLLV